MCNVATEITGVVFAKWRCGRMTRVPLHHCHVSTGQTAPAASGNISGDPEACKSRPDDSSPAKSILEWWSETEVHFPRWKKNKKKTHYSQDQCVCSLLGEPGLPKWLQRERAGLKVTVQSCPSTTVGAGKSMSISNLATFLSTTG